MTDPEPAKLEQWQLAIRTLSDVLATQRRAPEAISLEELSAQLHSAADGHGRQGNYQAAQLLDQWAHLVTQPVEG